MGTKFIVRKISASCVLNGKQSDSCTVLSGVPQGSVLGPLLFLCYINDLLGYVQSSIRLYADDALIHRKIHSKADQDILQQDLYMLTQWASTWQMIFNPQKSACVLEDYKQTAPPCLFLLHEHAIHRYSRLITLSILE